MKIVLNLKSLGGSYGRDRIANNKRSSQFRYGSASTPSTILYDVERKLESGRTENPTPNPREKRIKGTPSIRTQEIGWQKESGRAGKNSLDHSEFPGHIRAYIQTA